MLNAEKSRVLIVDDEHSNILTLTHILSPQYIVYAAKNGDNAVKAAEKYLPDVILLDIIMPDMDGYDVLSVLKNSSRTKNIPVIFITGLSDVGEEEKGLALGAADYISKPFSSAVVKLRTANQIKIQTALRQAEIANNAKSRFLSTASHEIRTPMNAIIGMSELLAREELNKRQMNYLNDIISSAHSLLNIINDILDMSKIEAGKLSINPVHYNFQKFISNIKYMFKFIANKKGLKFELEIKGEIPDCLFGDDIRLRQVLINICANAVKFTEKGFVKLRISSADGLLIFEVEDTGKGIHEDDIPKLFSAFEQVDKLHNRGVSGTGLGLFISKSFIEMMGGDITVSSKYGEGTIFTFKIPIIEGDKELIKLSENKKKELITAPNAEILVVDDNEFNLRVAQGLFGLSKIEVKTATSGKEAIEMVQNEPFDIIFMDQMMPEMDGVEATGIIRKLGGKFEKIPIIALTANAVQGAREMFLENGFDGFMSKPIDLHELNKILVEFLPSEKISEIPDEYIETADSNPLFMKKLDEIDEINTQTGLSRFSDIEDMYLSATKHFCKSIINECAEMSAFLNDRNLRKFAIAVHAMKSALSTVGATGLSETAQNLETAAKENAENYCLEQYPDFEEKLISLHRQLSEIFKTEGGKKTADDAFLQESIKKILLTADDFDNYGGVEIIDNLLEYDFDEKIKLPLEKAKTALKELDFDAAVEILNGIGCK